MSTTADHPLVEMLRNAALGRFRPADGLVEVFPSPPSPADAAWDARSLRLRWT